MAERFLCHFTLEVVRGTDTETTNLYSISVVKVHVLSIQASSVINVVINNTKLMKQYIHATITFCFFKVTIPVKDGFML
ncbi:hypothetical protein [Endozoicomonas atrinae]|uniref:hypothetical protein n=1 Tax=Endozoicomonas atrinae TaxID=1333660 RepID=UPI00082545F2|nr:hypothetical protein [Endozoicomonas atrinae]